MVISRYTFLFCSESRYYIYNTLSNALIETGEDKYRFLESLQKKNSVYIPGVLDKELETTLTRRRFLVEDNRDEFLLYKASIQNVREQREFMHLTIAPTMDCNFRCFYCFEDHKNRRYMSEDVMSSIVKYLQSLRHLKRMKITWFGGEPMMAKDQILSLYEKISGVFHGKTESDIITAGYYIDEDTPEFFKNIGINSVQITLDGNRESHNKVKFTEECDDVFSKVIQNVQALTSAMPEIIISFRVNITKRNFLEYPDIYKYLYSVFEGKRISISPAIVKDKGKGIHYGTETDTFFDNSSFADYILDLFDRHGIHTPFIRYPGDQLCECAVRDKMAISFDPEGYAYKCWEKIGDRKYAIGRLDADGKLKDINTKELNRELYGADPLVSSLCSRCRYLPICNGGCPIERIQNEFEGGHNNTCTFFKGKIDKFLKAHLKIKKTGFSNR